MRIWFTLPFTILLISTGLAQTNNSPYSIHALGDITDNIINRTSGLSSTGIAYRNNRSIITNNPASLSALENQFFIGEIGVNGQYVNYTGNPISLTNHQSSDISFKRFSIATKIFPHWGSAAGLVPYSEENYEYSGNRPIGYTGNSLPSYDQGYGGINKIFWSNGYDFLKHFSVGLTTSYLFGSIDNKNIILGQGSSISSIYISKNNNSYFSGINLEYGLQYFGSINGHWDITLGGVFSNEQKLNSTTTVTIVNIDSSLLRSNITTGNYTLPTSYGLGLSITRNKKYTLVADYKFQNWSSQRTTTGDFFYQNSQRASLGFEISNKKVVFNNLFETSFFQAGFYYNKSYLIVNGTSINDIGGTIGMGVNSKRFPQSLALLVVLQYGVKGTAENNLIRENYANLSFIFSFRDFWFTHGRKFD